MYGIDATDGSVYRLFNGTSDNETAIVYQEEGRAEDFSNPLVYKNGGEFKLKLRVAEQLSHPTEVLMVQVIHHLQEIQ